MSDGRHPQPGITAFGTTDHAYLELDLRPGADPVAVRATIATLALELTTGAGCMLVVGFRPELWARLAPTRAPEGVHGFDDPVVGPDGFTMPATQHDLVLWVAGGARDVVFDEARALVAALAEHTVVAEEQVGWTYQYHRDLTGFLDGTENPALAEIPEVAVVAEGPSAGSSVLLLQRWPHDTASWDALTTEEQEQAIGRTKPDSVELDHKPDASHAARTDQDEIGKIVRRNMPYGTTTTHGTMFVGLCRDQGVLHTMLVRMAGGDGGPRDALTFHTRAETGAYYVLPAIEDVMPDGDGDGDGSGPPPSR